MKTKTIMSSKNFYRLSGVLLLAALSGLAACDLAAAQSEKPDGEPANALLLVRSSMANYQRWTRVNPKPLLFHAASAAQCAAAFPSQLPSPHREKYITVYVNDAGKRAMLTQETPFFPVGTVIVKEKRATPAAAPELLTVMVKHQKGFNPDNGDWEYAVLDGSAARIQAQGRLANCQSCHQGQKRLDYTFRDNYFAYLRGKHMK